MENSWNIKINETNKPFKGFSVSVEKNGEYAGAIKGVLSTFDDAIKGGRSIVLSEIKISDNKKKYAKEAQASFTKQYLLGDFYNGVYGVGIKIDEKGEPYLSVKMDTNNKYLMQLIPDSISSTDGSIKYEIKKEHGEQTAAQPFKK